jgi:hypothetical protein
MLAAHRCGGRRTGSRFARAWDGFTGARGRARRASERELRVLTTHLEASLEQDSENADLGRAIAEHRDLQGRPEPVRPSEPDRSQELSPRPGWAWLRPFRRYDDYRRALARAEEMGAELETERERQPVR